MKFLISSVFSVLIITIILLGFTSKQMTFQGPKPRVAFKENKAEKRVDVTVNGKLFTSYAWPDTVMKPILYPVLTSAGTEITRGFPLNTRAGERADHPHHVGIWLNYGDVNGFDFWGNSYEIPAKIRSVHSGKIVHQGIEKMTAGVGEGAMVVKASWIDPFGKELLSERTEYHFIAEGSTRIIDRITTLTATQGDVKMNDTKEGMFGIRVARQLELPLNDEVTLTDALGNPTKVKKLDNKDVSGNYVSSEGITGENVWGTRAKWMNLYGNIGSEKISIVISDFPENPNYPTYWHARGYGLFCANPFGVKDFTKGKEVLNYKIANGNSVTLRYRVIVNSGSYLTNTEINTLTDQFAKKYK